MYAVPSLKSLSLLIMLALYSYFIIRGCEAYNDIFVYEDAEYRTVMPEFCGGGTPHLTLMCRRAARKNGCEISNRMAQELKCADQTASLYSKTLKLYVTCQVSLLVCPLTCGSKEHPYVLEIALGRSPYDEEKNVVRFTKEEGKKLWEPECDLPEYLMNLKEEEA